jgi:PAS domain S-box-containing protein
MFHRNRKCGAAVTAEPIATQIPARRGDGLIVVTQNNAEKALTIQHMNAEIEEMLGYTEEKAVGRRLEVILSSRTAQFLDEEIDYRDDAPDLGDVFQRQREVKLRHRSGKEIPVNCTISRLMSEGMSAKFQLVIPNEKEKLARQKIRDFISLNLEGRKQLDVATGLPNRDTALDFLPLLTNYLAEIDASSVVAVLRLDRHEKSVQRYGEEACAKLLQHTANCCQSTFRSDDLIFTLSDYTLGLVLFDISLESARLVLNRLRWNIRSHHLDFGGKANFSVSVSLAFDQIRPETRGDELLMRCEDAVGSLDDAARNELMEMSA